MPTFKYRQVYTIQNSAEWIRSGKGYFERMEELIDSAVEEIHLQTYIFASDDTGKPIAEALIRAAVRKVQVFILVDAFGSQGLSSELILRMKNSGINFRKFGLLYSKGTFHIGRRMHHKVTVIDGLISIVGGINISDNYNDTKNGKAWLDFAVIMQGEISSRIQYICRQRWDGWSFPFTSRKKSSLNTKTQNLKSGSCQIRVRRNDFIRNKNDIANSYQEVFRSSEKSIILIGGYFLPGGKTRRLMRNAVKRGVNFIIVVSEKSDSKIYVLARQYLYAWLIRNGIQVYIYNPSNVHGKVLICDNKLTSIGSYDLNNLSTYSNIELNVDIKDENFSTNLSSYILKIIQEDCSKIDSQNMYKDKTLIEKPFMWLSYRFVKTLFVLSVWLAGKKEKYF